jgi:NADPH-dependent ferric siderophore reductase
VIEIACVNDESIVTVRFRGRLSVSDLNVFETALSDRHAGRQHIRVLFDWTGIEGWEPGTGDPARWPNWRDTTRPIERAAIIHERRWNRQAALLAAMLRINKAQARSWLPRNLPDALVWLNEK